MRKRQADVDDSSKRLAREMTDAISKAVEADFRVQTIRRRAREAGLDMSVTLDATIRFGSRGDQIQAERPTHTGASMTCSPSPIDLSESDRRFLRSLRIAAPASIRVD